MSNTPERIWLSRHYPNLYRLEKSSDEDVEHAPVSIAGEERGTTQCPICNAVWPHSHVEAKFFSGMLIQILRQLVASKAKEMTDPCTRALVALTEGDLGDAREVLAAFDKGVIELRHGAISRITSGSAGEDAQVAQRLAAIRELAAQNSGPKFGYTHKLAEAVKYLLALVSTARVQATADDAQVAQRLADEIVEFTFDEYPDRKDMVRGDLTDYVGAIIDRALSTARQQGAGLMNRSFWVLEQFKDDQSQGYWKGCRARHFTGTIEEATQFCRRQDVLSQLTHHSWAGYDVRPTEHLDVINREKQGAEAERRAVWDEAITVARESAKQSMKAGVDIAAAEILIRRLEIAKEKSP